LMSRPCTEIVVDVVGMPPTLPRHRGPAARPIIRRVPLFEPIFKALDVARVRYVTVGGVAVVLHGHARLTADLDLAVDLAPPAEADAIEALTGIGFRPRLPVDASVFADPAVRERWISEQGMTVFTLWDPDDPLRSIDLFVDPPIDFEELWGRSVVVDIEGTPVRVASIPDLISMKRLADRPMDREDVAALEAIAEVGRER